MPEHLDLSEDLPIDRYYMVIDIPDDLEILELRNEDLPANWDSNPPTLDTQFISDDFVIENEAAVLKVPSCIVPLEFNYLINTDHPDAKRITVISKEPLKFDNRIKQAIKL